MASAHLSARNAEDRAAVVAGVSARMNDAENSVDYIKQCGLYTHGWSTMQMHININE